MLNGLCLPKREKSLAFDAEQADVSIIFIFEQRGATY